MFGFTRKPAETAALVPVAQAQMLNAVGHFAGRDGGSFYTAVHEELAQKWSWYEGVMYDDLRYDWAGAPMTRNTSGLLAKALVPRADGVPPGFRSMNVPKLAERRPTSPQRVVPRVVDRFTSLLFGEDCHPKIRCIGDEQTGYWLQSFAATSRLWSKMVMARTIGGAQGAVGIGLRAVDGQPRIDVFDPRFTKQFWRDREELILRAIEVRYKIPVLVKVKGGDRELVHYWVRRVVSDQADLRYYPVWCSKRQGMELEDGVSVRENPSGQEPDWERLINPDESVRHDLGFCPVVWIQNSASHTSEYGREDCAGLYGQARDIDEQRAQISQCVKANLDPTVVMTTEDGSFPENLKKGHGQGIGLQKGNTASYLEANLGTVTIASSWFERCIDGFFKEADCLELAKDAGTPQTATEIRQKMGPQQSRTSMLREQYGQLGVRRVLEMAIKMERANNSRTNGEGQPLGFSELEPRIVKPEVGEDRVESVRLGPGGYIEVSWPPIARPSVAEVGQAVTAAVGAKQGGVADVETAVAFAAPYLGVEDAGALVARLKTEAEETARAQQQFGGGQPPTALPQEPTGQEPPVF